MGVRLGIGIGVGRNRRSQYWTQQKIVNTFLFDAFTKDIAGGKLYNTVKGREAEYLTVTGSAGSYHYACPNNATYIAADTDYAWFKTDGSVSDMTDSRLNSYDLQRTPVLFDDDSPNTNRRISILLSTVTLSATDLNHLFQTWHLPIEWHNDTNAYGHIKFNRTGQNLWTPESVNPAIPTGLTATLISGGVKWDWTAGDAAAQTEVWCRNDSDAYTTATYTINAGIVTKSETITAVDLRYCKIRSLKGGLYSAFTAEVSIAMLSAELIPNGAFTSGTGWTVATPPWSITGGKACYDNSGTNCLYINSVGLLNSTYRVKFNVDHAATIWFGTAGGANSLFNAPLAGWHNYTTGDQTIIAVCGFAYTVLGLWGNNTSGAYNLDNLSIKKILMP
jgi:hypothetical protein